MPAIINAPYTIEISHISSPDGEIKNPPFSSENCILDVITKYSKIRGRVLA